MRTSSFNDSEPNKQAYKVLARKYRPQDFECMIGQEALVKTFRNAIKSDRIAHAFLLTGIRGVGKTTTARIMAKALNCTGENGDLEQPQEQPCGKCINCTSINDDCHQDVLELDAASHTGVSDMREVIDNVKYKPLSGRYKVYIIDEAHMLSNSAFNALLKTLEEPPAHTKFILATTEVRKIPATIISRCQRFDLRRVDSEVLKQHFINVAAQEGVSIEEKAAYVIANIAAGSVRDGLSILDQAISHCESQITYEQVSAMLGLTNLSSRLDLLTDITCGDANKTLKTVNEIYNNGGDPMLLLQDLLEVIHAVTKIKVLKLNPAEIYGKNDSDKYSLLADKLKISFLNRAWQIISKGIDEVKNSYNTLQACEMVLIRLLYSASLPSIEDLLRDGDRAAHTPVVSTPINSSPNNANKESMPKAALNINANFLLQLCLDHEELMLHHHIMSDLIIIEFIEGKLTIQLKDWAPKNLPRQLQEFLNNSTNTEWVVLRSEGSSGLTLSDLQALASDAKKQEISENPLVKDILNTFADLEIAEIKPVTIN